MTKAIGTILKQFRHKTTPTTTKPTTPTTPTVTATSTATTTPTTKTKTTVHSEVKRLLSRRDFTAAQKLFSLSPSPFPATSLISFASRELSSLSIAFSIYDSLKKTKGVSPDSFVFTALVGACQKLGGSSNIPSLWQDITHYKIKVDSRLYTTLISVCIAANDTVTLRQILSQIDKDQLQPDIILQTFLVKAYSIVGEIEKAFKIWETIKKEGSMKIDAQLLVSILTLCSETKSLERGREVHKVINESRICEKSKKDELALKSSLVNMYAKCGNLQDAQAVFNSMQSRDIVSWTAMLQAYSINGSMQEALQLYNEMNKHGIAANNFTYSIILSVMADMTNLNEGKRIHNQIKGTYGCVINYPQVVVNALISMYAKCGDLDQVFEEYKSKANTVTWTAIIQSYSIHGFAKQALDLFQQMTQHKMTPNQTTLICIITACSHAGLVETAWDIYSSMQQKFGIKPDIRHQACMVDAWGRAGMLDSAEKFISGLADQNVIFWKTLLGASCNYRDVERSQRVAAKILQVEPNDASTYVLLANTYGAAGMMNEQASVWKQMLDNNIKKTPGATWVTVNGKSDVFYVDSSHLHKHDIMNFLAKTRTQLINEYQYEPELSCVLHPNLSEQEKIERLWTHSEKMATAWAILNNEPGPIIMHKNLRVCQDCHKAMKLMSRLFSKTFIVRDANRFHHFEDGKCSCNEYW